MAVTFQDYYAALGVPRAASAEDIKKAFRKLARIHHPDVAKDKVAGEAKFKEINEAYEVLSDPEKRRQYDELGADWQNGSRGPRTPRGYQNAPTHSPGVRPISNSTAQASAIFSSPSSAEGATVSAPTVSRRAARTARRHSPNRVRTSKPICSSLSKRRCAVRCGQ